jgi:hypothetical protein
MSTIKFWSQEEFDTFLEQVTAYDAHIDLLKKANTQQDVAHSELVKRVSATETLGKGLQQFDAEVWSKLTAHATAADALTKRVGAVEATTRDLIEADKPIRTRLDTSEKKYADLLDLYKNLSKQIDGVKGTDAANDHYARASVAALTERCAALSAANNALQGLIADLTARVVKLETPTPVVPPIPPVVPTEPQQ